MQSVEQADGMNLAAVVYDDGVAIDSLLTEFARELAAQGVRIGGVVQVPRDGPGCGPDAPMLLQDVATGEIISICQRLGPGAQSCRLDPRGLAEAAMRIRRAAEDSVDLLFVSKFGKQEASGQGFRNELALSALSGSPVLTGVRRGLVDNWLSFTGGLGTLLNARLWVLRDWWKEVAARQHLSVASNPPTQALRDRVQ